MPRLLARTAAPPAPPRTVGPWELGQLVGEGAFTRVYRARPAGLRNAPGHAVKLVRADHCDAATGKELIAREARAAAAVSHPNLVAVVASHVDGDAPYLVMPLLVGATLADRLAAGQRFALPVVLSFLRQIAGALAALAAEGFRHGDVKPANVMISPTGHATLIDLGFACRRDESPALDDRLWLGTPEYAAPERFTSRILVDAPSDVYSLGVLAYLLFTGRRPCEAATVAELAALHVHQVAPILRDQAPTLPGEIASGLQRTLAKDPLRRPTADELVEMLARWEIDCFTDRATHTPTRSASFEVAPLPVFTS